MAQADGTFLDKWGATILLAIIMIGCLHLATSMCLYIKVWGLWPDWKVYEAAARAGATNTGAFADPMFKQLHFVYPPIALRLFVLLEPTLPVILMGAYIASGLALGTRRLAALAQGLLVFSGLTLFTEDRFSAAIVFANISIFLHLLIIWCWISSVRSKTHTLFWLAVAAASLIKPYFLAYLIVPFIVTGARAADIKRALSVLACVCLAWTAQAVFWRDQFDAFLGALRSQSFAGDPGAWLNNIGHGFLFYFATLTGGLGSALALYAALSICLTAAALVMGSIWRRRNMPLETISLVALALAILVNPRLKSYDDSLYCGLLTGFLLVATPASVRVLRNWLVTLAVVALCSVAVIARYTIGTHWAFHARVGIDSFAPLLIVIILEVRLLFAKSDRTAPSGTDQRHLQPSSR